MIIKTDSDVKRAPYVPGKDNWCFHKVEGCRGLKLRVLPGGKKVFFLRYRTEDGRQRAYSWKGDARDYTLKAVVDEAMGLIRAVNRGQDPKAEPAPVTRKTVKDLCETFLERYAKVYRKSWANDAAEIRLHILPTLGGVIAEDLSTGQILDWHNSLAHYPRTANKVMQLLGRILVLAAEWGEVPSDVPARVAAVKPFDTPSRDRWLRKAEVVRLFEAVDRTATIPANASKDSDQSKAVAFLTARGSLSVSEVASELGIPKPKVAILLAGLVKQGRIQRVDRGVYGPLPVGDPWTETYNLYPRAVLYLLFLTALRKGELLPLRWNQVDLERGRISLEMTKAGESQERVLSPTAVEIFKVLEKHKRGPFVFPSSTGKSGHLSSVTAFWEKVRDDAGLQGVTLHDFRRSAASWMAQAGASALVLQRALGHKTIAASLIYSRMAAEPVEQAVSQLADTFQRVREEARGKVVAFPEGGQR
ncbi:MAG: tyrosine-type recombinase/integrase [Bradymonadales bacterium]|nr:tyrosine-type recombinase/integrase [Bradymonadales bacterium]